MEKNIVFTFMLLSFCIVAIASDKTNLVKHFEIVCSDVQTQSSEILYPKRVPDEKAPALSGVYNDSLQTLMLTFNFNSDDACVTIYKNFNKMYQENIAVSKGTTAVYDMSDYGEGNFVVDVRSGQSTIETYYGTFISVTDTILN